MLRDFFIWLFDNDKPLDIEVFSFWHILYAVVIIGLTITLGIFISRKSDKVKDTVMRLIACSIAVIYTADFFIQPLMHGDSSVGGEMNIDKLPFHICTVLCPIIAFAQFNKRFAFMKEPIAFLAIVAPLMYITYPNGALVEVSPLSYKIIQTFVYHGLVFSWGFNMLASGTVKPKIMNWWKSLIAIICIALWASLGNAIYSNPDHHYDWFFLTGSSFPFVPEPLMPLAVVAAILGMVFIIYGIYYGFMAIKESVKAKRELKA